MKPYDYIVVGAGFFGSVFARLVTDAGYKVLVLDQRNHIGGNAYTEKVDDIDVHVYGPHIFHTNNKDIWEFVNRYSKFNSFVNSPKVFKSNQLYSLPFNMNTFYQIWGVTTPDDAKKIIESQQLKLDRPAANLEEQALSLVGTDIYNLLIKEYTQKQWQKDPKDLPADIIKRLPLRFTFDDNYFNDRWQGIPEDGYTKLFENLLEGIEIRLGIDYLEDRIGWDNQADQIVFTGQIDKFFNYEFGELDYRTLKFDTVVMDTDNYQGNAVINYPSLDVPWTRVIEHKHFNKSRSKRTVVTKEIPTAWTKDSVPYYPINNDANQKIYQQYKEKSKYYNNIIFGGRLAEYRYYDMHQVIGSAMQAAKIEIQKRTV